MIIVLVKGEESKKYNLKKPIEIQSVVVSLHTFNYGPPPLNFYIDSK